MECVSCNSECCKIKLGATNYEVKNILSRFKGIYEDYFEEYHSVVSIVKRPDGRCVFLDKENRCKIYHYKPNGCNTYKYPDCKNLGVMGEKHG